MDEAVEQQQDLLAEFEKIADELNRVLANLEGSTLVKRLKAAVAAPVQGRRPDQRAGEPTLRRGGPSTRRRRRRRSWPRCPSRKARGATTSR